MLSLIHVFTLASHGVEKFRTKGECRGKQKVSVKVSACKSGTGWVSCA